MPHSHAAHLAFPAIEQHINQLLLTQAHCTQALKVVALGAEPEHRNFAFQPHEGQRAYSALRVLTCIEIIMACP